MLKKRFWTTKNIIFTILVVCLLLILPKIIGILMLFFGAYVIACALNPFVRKLMIRMNNRSVASSLVFIIPFHCLNNTYLILKLLYQ